MRTQIPEGSGRGGTVRYREGLNPVTAPGALGKSPPRLGMNPETGLHWAAPTPPQCYAPSSRPGSSSPQLQPQANCCNAGNGEGDQGQGVVPFPGGPGPCTWT